jgi:hypothetical protein
MRRDLAERAIQLRVLLRKMPLVRGKAQCVGKRESMPPPKKTHDLALSLVARETDPNRSSLRTEPATVRVYERLRRQLGDRWELTAFRLSLPVLWLSPRRNLPSSELCR